MPGPVTTSCAGCPDQPTQAVLPAAAVNQFRDSRFSSARSALLCVTATQRSPRMTKNKWLRRYLGPTFLSQLSTSHLSVRPVDEV